MHPRAWSLAALVVSLAALLCAVVLDRTAPFPSADVARGSEEAFASGLELREFTGPQKTPERWGGGRVLVDFRNLPAGDRLLEVALHQHRQPVLVVAEGVIVGSLGPGVNQMELRLPPSRRADLTIELRTETFAAGGGRRLGARFDRVVMRHARGGLPPLGLVFAMALGALSVLLGARASGCSAPAATALAVVALLFQASLLWPMGLLRSPYALTLPVLIALGAALGWLFARWRRTPWAFAALLVAWLVQAVAMTSPMAVMSDAVMHANKLVQVAGGDLFPVSLTQHAKPFRFPYGVSFYALLAPLLLAGLDPVALVRYGAGIAGALSAVPVFAIAAAAAATPARAALAVLVLQVLPITCDTFAYGNLSNIFGQAVTLAFLAWWLAPRCGATCGAILLVTAALSHLSCVIVLAVLVPALLLFGLRGRARVIAVAVATVVAALYYAQFLPLMLEQLPRLAEGGGSGRRSVGLLSALWTQVQDALGRWGIPATVLAALGLRRRRSGEADRLLVATWWTGAVLLLVAAVSPIEVRYIYAMGFAVAVAAAHGLFRLSEHSFAGKLVGWGLIASQTWTALQGLQEILISRYRL